MRESSEINIPKLRVINADYSEPEPLKLDIFNIIAELDKEVRDIEGWISFRRDFKDYKSQILYELDEGLTQDSLFQIEKFIEYFLEDKKNEKNDYKNDYFIYNFSFDRVVVQEFLKLNHLSEEERKYDFKEMFLDKFENFIVNKGFRKFPNTKDWYLIFYRKGLNYDFDFKFEYTPWFYDEWVINKELDIVENSKLSVKKLMEEKVEDEIDTEIEYNNYIKDLFLEFLDTIIYNKAIASNDFIFWDFRQDFLIIRKFIVENTIFIQEVEDNNISFSLLLHLINSITQNQLLTIQELEHKMNRELKNLGIFNVELNEIFYKSLKIETDYLFQWLNSLVKTKKTS